MVGFSLSGNIIIKQKPMLSVCIFRKSWLDSAICKVVIELTNSFSFGSLLNNFEKELLLMKRKVSYEFLFKWLLNELNSPGQNFCKAKIDFESQNVKYINRKLKKVYDSM